VDDYPGSAIATALEGIGRGMVVMLAGTAGVGKSTLAAQAGFVIARQTGACLYWLDADQLKEELIEETFYRARCPPDGLAGRIFPVHDEREDGMPDFRRACARVPENGVAVIDSLEAWAPRGDKQALELLRVLRAHPCRVKLVVAATNASGGVAGDGELERACDATVFVERMHLRVGKCRWTIGTTWTRRGPGGLEVERAQDDDAMDEASEVVAEDAPAPGRAWLSERERAALDKLMRWWPPMWKRVTAREIVDAVAYGGLDDLADALRELSNANELNPLNVGYALRWVKDRPLNGRALTSEIDRKTKRARWGVVRIA
jgi:energy-coupling factor transporter ATP-binding protein EcfA2